MILYLVFGLVSVAIAALFALAVVPVSVVWP